MSSKDLNQDDYLLSRPNLRKSFRWFFRLRRIDTIHLIFSSRCNLRVLFLVNFSVNPIPSRQNRPTWPVSWHNFSPTAALSISALNLAGLHSSILSAVTYGVHGSVKSGWENFILMKESLTSGQKQSISVCQMVLENTVSKSFTWLWIATCPTLVIVTELQNVL